MRFIFNLYVLIYVCYVTQSHIWNENGDVLWEMVNNMVIEIVIAKGSAPIDIHRRMTGVW